MPLDKETVQKLVEGKLQSGEVDPAQVVEYERAAKVMRITMMKKLMNTDFVPAEVVPGVFLGSIGAAGRPDHLTELGVTHVLCVGINLPRKVGEEFVFQTVEVFDSPSAPLSDHFPECFAFIEDALSSGGKVLVHCFAGKSRSATVVIAYLLQTTAFLYNEAFDMVREARPAVNPNPGFCLQLVKFYCALHPDRPRPGCEKVGDQDPKLSRSGSDGGAEAFMEIVEKAGRTNALLNRDDDMVVLWEKFGVCKQHLTIVPAKPINGIKALCIEDIPLLEAQHQRGIAEFARRIQGIQTFEGISEAELPNIIVAGFFHPATLEQLQLHMLLPPFRTERVCAYPKWHSYGKVLGDLKAHGRVIAYDEEPNNEEGKSVQEVAIALHRRFKQIEQSAPDPEVAP